MSITITPSGGKVNPEGAQLKIEFKIVEQMGPYPVPRLIEAHGREILVVTVELEPPGAPLFRPRAGRVQEPAPDAAPPELRVQHQVLDLGGIASHRSRNLELHAAETGDPSAAFRDEITAIR